MDELDIQGKKYISSKRASIITGYAKDYIGQLARGNKIPATRVGRAWYVEESSVLEHAGLTQTIEPDGATLEDAVHEKTSINPEDRRIVVKPGKNEQFLYSLQSLQGRGITKNVLKTWSTVNYIQDTEPLLPSVKTKERILSTPISEKKILTLKNIVSSPRRTPYQSVSIDGITFKPVQEHVVQEPLKINATPNSSSKARMITKKQLLIPLSGLTLTVVAIFLVIALSFTSSSSIAQNGSSINLTSAVSASDSFEFIKVFFGSIFFAGVDLIRAFLTLLVASLDDFFNTGLNFILNLL